MEAVVLRKGRERPGQSDQDKRAEPTSVGEAKSEKSSGTLALENWRVQAHEHGGNSAASNQPGERVAANLQLS